MRSVTAKGAHGVAVFYLLLALGCLWPAVRHPDWWLWSPGAPHSDLAVTHWPNAHFTRRSLWEEGEFPLWRPTIMSGTPFAANPLAGLYYPPNWLFLFLPWLPLEVGFNLSALVHLWLAGVAMYALMRRGLGAGTWSALAAGAVYQASPKLLAHLGAGHIGWTQAWAWLPLVVLCWLRASESANQRTGRWAIGAGVTLAAVFCADVRMAAYALAAVGTLALLSSISATKTWRPLHFYLSRSLLFALPLLIFLGLSACQWLPMAALLRETTRSAMTLRDAAVWSLPWRYLAGLLLADHGGFHEWMTYAGITSLILAGAGIGALWRNREKRWLFWWLGSLMVGAAWFSLGENGGLFPLLWRFVPGVGLLRVPPRAWVLVTFALAVFAGFGVEAGRDVALLRPYRQRAILLATGALPPLLTVGYWAMVGKPPLNLLMFGLLPPLTLLCCVRPGCSRFASHISRPALLVALIAVDLLVVDRTLIEARSPAEVFAEGRSAAEWLARLPGRFRVYSPSYSIPQHVAELYGLELADGVDPLQLRAYADYLTRAAGLTPQGYSVILPPFPEGTEDIRTALRDVTPDAAALGLLGVRYLAAAFPVSDSLWRPIGRFDDVYLYENRQARPLPETDTEYSITLADGNVLFRYRPWPVYVGWVISGLIVLKETLKVFKTFRVSSGEWWFVMLVGALLLLLTTLPYLAGFAVNHARAFSGFIYAVEDGNSYLAKMQEGAAGHWLFYLAYTPEAHRGELFFLYYILLGKISRYLGLSMIAGLHLSRIVTVPAGLFCYYRFIAYWTPDRSVRRLGLLLFSFTAGLGWLWLLLGAKMTPGALPGGSPVDLWAPDASYFFSALLFPHLPLAQGLLLIFVVDALKFLSTGQPRPGVQAAITGLLVSLIHPYTLPVIGAILGIFACGQMLAHMRPAGDPPGDPAGGPLRRWPFWTRVARTVWRLALLIAPAAPYLAYNLVVFWQNPAFRAWREQSQTVSPAPHHYLLGMGLILAWAAVGAATRRRGGLRQEWGFLVTWALVVPLLLYLPTSIQRRFLDGYQAPLTVLGACGILDTFARVHSIRLRRALTLLSFSVMTLTNLLLLIGALVLLGVGVGTPTYPEPIFRPLAEQRAADWLAGRAQGQVVLSSRMTGNYLPTRGALRVFLGHGPETVNSEEKQKLVARFFGEENDAWRRQLLAEYHVQWVWWGPWERMEGNFDPHLAPYLAPAYEADGYSIFRVRE